MRDEIKKITKEQAVSLIGEGDIIHTFRNGGGMVFGADWGRESLIEAFEKYESTLELTGEGARRMGHGLAFRDNYGALFVETDEKKLNEFDPLDQTLN